MANYYEILEIPVTASKKEIESAIDQQYTYWHRLVTHHDPSKVEEANRSLRLLEEVRSVLTNSAKRKKYDAEIGLKSDKTAGLADPQATAPHAKLPSMNIAQNVMHQESVQATTEVWNCGKCKTPNRIGLKFCGKCGTQIGRECIKCNKMVSTADIFCPYCGIDIAKEQARRIAEQQEKERQKEMEEAACISRQREMDRRQAEEKAKQIVKEKVAKRNFGIFVLVGSIAVMVFIAIGYMRSQQREQRYIENLIALNPIGENEQILCSVGCFGNTMYINILKAEFDKDYLYIYFDGYSGVDQWGKTYPLRVPDHPSLSAVVGSYNAIFIHESDYFLSVNEDFHKSGYVRFNIKDIQPSLTYQFCYYSNYTCVDLFTSPAK